MRKLEDIYKVLEKKKELTVEIKQVIDSLEEKDELALYIAKKQYFAETNRLANDSLLSKRKRRRERKAEDRIAAQDTAFDNYLNAKLHISPYQLITVEDKCIQLVGDSMLSNKVHNMIVARNKEVMDYLVKKKLIAPERIKVVTNKDSVLLKDLPDPKFDIKYKAQDDKEE